MPVLYSLPCGLEDKIWLPAGARYGFRGLEKLEHNGYLDLLLYHEISLMKEAFYHEYVSFCLLLLLFVLLLFSLFSFFAVAGDVSPSLCGDSASLRFGDCSLSVPLRRADKLLVVSVFVCF